MWRRYQPKLMPSIRMSSMPATLPVSSTEPPRVFLVYTLSIVHGATFGAFANYDDAAFLALANASLHKFDELVAAGGVLGYDGSLGTCCYGTVLCKETSITSHDLNKEYTFV